MPANVRLTLVPATAPLSFRTADSPETASELSHPYEAFGDQLATRLLSVEAGHTAALRHGQPPRGPRGPCCYTRVAFHCCSTTYTTS
ncbi:hypothetical protein MTO96_030193 [Rhipicephalus appendiculatus]